jgi:hypothetical protein
LSIFYFTTSLSIARSVSIVKMNNIDDNDTKSTKKAEEPDPSTRPGWVQQQEEYVTNYYQPFIQGPNAAAVTRPPLEPDNPVAGYRSSENAPSDVFGMRGSDYFANDFSAADYDRHLRQARSIYGDSYQQNPHCTNNHSQPNQQGPEASSG